MQDLQIGKRRKWRGMMAVAGGIMIHITLGTFYTFGNLSPYMTSYIRERSKPSDLTYEMSTWIFAVAGVMQGGFMYFGGRLDKRFGARVSVLIGSLIQSTGVFLTYFTIQSSFYLVIISYGVIVGLGVALAYGPALTCAMRWFPKHKGVASGLIVAGFGGGAFIFNQVQTAYINPENLSPVESPSGEKFFNQEEILDRTPKCFLLMGGCYLAIQLIGCLLVSDPPTNKHVSIQEEFEPEKQALVPKEENDDFDTRWSGKNLKTRDVLKTRAFWTLWLTLVFNLQTQVLVSSLYKAYGQNFISDDHFLALVGSFSSVFNCSGRVFWGYLGDRFSFRDAMLVLTTTSVVFVSTFIATEEAGKVMFFFWVCAIFFTFSGNFALFPTATARSFGEEHAGTNYGVLFTASTVSSVTGTLTANVLSKQIGWVGLFYYCAGCSIVGAILTFTFNVKTPSGRDI